MKKKSTQDQVTVLTIQGDLDVETFPRLLRQAEACFDQGNFDLLIDLRQAGSISNGGLIALQTIAARAADRGGKAILTGVKSDVAIGTDVAGVLQTHNIFPAVNSAPTSFAQS